VFSNEDGQKAMQARFAGHGIGAERLLLKPSIASHFLHFHSYGEIDIALDPFPYNGTTTTCDALWMGVPTVSLVGPGFPERLSYSNLTNAGLEDLAVFSVVDYVAKAAELAADLTRRAALRKSARATIRANPLGQPERFTRAFYDLAQRVASE
jgi:predicted O-linked N-acetylglucosamine transferase (SPINDLY family)